MNTGNLCILKFMKTVRQVKTPTTCQADICTSTSKTPTPV